MDSTPPRSKLSCRYNNNKTAIKKGNGLSDSLQCVASTPANSNQQGDQDSDYSPIYFPSTQETNEDIDVLWDWHSPQTSHRRRKKQKRLLPVQSPKLPVKRHPSNTQTQNFEKLKDELRALKEELALPDDESCLCISPQQETEFKEGDGNNLVLKTEQGQLDHFDMFDDSIDEQLLLFSQQVENDLEKSQNDQCEKNKEDSFANICDNIEINNLINKYSEKSLTPLSSNKKNSISFQRTLSENKFNKYTGNNIESVSGKFKFDRAKSFDLETTTLSAINLPQITLKEIERKRQEAKARLESKRKQNSNCINNTIISPVKYSENLQTASNKNDFQRTKSFEMEAVNHSQIVLPKSTLEEIERKRLEAKARLESKKKQEKPSYINNTTVSPVNSHNDVIQTASGKLEFHRTKSFELEVNHDQFSLPKNTLDEIERKRLEAKARLEAKKKQEQSSYINSSAATSPTKCSSKEIEKKRQQALAKLEAKRLQDIVEKNRQEALKRLQVTRMKKANLVKSTLTKRL